MRAFFCPHCDARIYFDSVTCLSCGADLAFDPKPLRFVPVPEGGGERHRCGNFLPAGCNWLTAHEARLCLSCGLNLTIPPVDDPLQQRRWAEVERAKRRLIYDLRRLGLAPMPIASAEAPLTFDILVSAEYGGSGKVIMGHDSGHITIDASEADSHRREERREKLGEAYRTMLGHMRHEAGHYFWDRLAALPGFADDFRALFGDERADYVEALKAYYAAPASDEWQASHISEYATAHPWEDWAETFAHYLHMMGGLETASHASLTRSGWKAEPVAAGQPSTIDEAVEQWIELSLFMNSMNRGLGHRDFYPFIIGPDVRVKIAFIADWLARLAAVQPGAEARAA